VYATSTLPIAILWSTPNGHPSPSEERARRERGGGEGYGVVNHLSVELTLPTDDVDVTT
jgi:hypothetical protein